MSQKSKKDVVARDGNDEDNDKDDLDSESNDLPHSPELSSFPDLAQSSPPSAISAPPSKSSAIAIDSQANPFTTRASLIAAGATLASTPASTPVPLSASSKGLLNPMTKANAQSSSTKLLSFITSDLTWSTKSASFPAIVTAATSAFSSQDAAPAHSSSSTSSLTPAQSDTGAEFISSHEEKAGNCEHRCVFSNISRGAEAACITLIVLGGLSLLIGAVMFFKRRRRGQKDSIRHAEDAFNPSNAGSLSRTEIYQASRLSQTTAATLFGGDSFRPVTLHSTDTSLPLQGRARHIPIQVPEPTPNPFVEPPLNKAYDVLRGRPRSTTLTDRGSWIRNPFRDPQSDRFDPFGTMQDKAREKRYVEQNNRQDHVKREQEPWAEEAMGPRLPNGLKTRMEMELEVAGARIDVRKGSDVTVEGVGVLDRSGSK